MAKVVVKDMYMKVSYTLLSITYVGTSGLVPEAIHYMYRCTVAMVMVVAADTRGQSIIAIHTTTYGASLFNKHVMLSWR